MKCLRLFILGTLAGLLITTLLFLLTMRFLPQLLVVDNQPANADALVVLGGDKDGSRLRAALKMQDAGLATHLLLTSGNQQIWEYIAKKICGDCVLEGRGAVIIEGATDTHTDAQFTLQYCRTNNFRKILVVTSPYHTRRAQLVFDDIFDDSDITPLVVSSGDYSKLVSPSGRWWSDQGTVETIWLEFGKILFWELTPFMEFQGEGKKLKEGERAR
jgi:uncharacterized SAM-binding protein YcdF (DUF218 family)